MEPLYVVVFPDVDAAVAPGAAGTPTGGVTVQLYVKLLVLPAGSVLALASSVTVLVNTCKVAVPVVLSV